MEQQDPAAAAAGDHVPPISLRGFVQLLARASGALGAANIPVPAVPTQFPLLLTTQAPHLHPQQHHQHQPQQHQHQHHQQQQQQQQHLVLLHVRNLLLKEVWEVLSLPIEGAPTPFQPQAILALWNTEGQELLLSQRRHGSKQRYKLGSADDAPLGKVSLSYNFPGPTSLASHDSGVQGLELITQLTLCKVTGLPPMAPTGRAAAAAAAAEDDATAAAAAGGGAARDANSRKARQSEQPRARVVRVLVVTDMVPDSVRQQQQQQQQQEEQQQQQEEEEDEEEQHQAMLIPGWVHFKDKAGRDKWAGSVALYLYCGSAHTFIPTLPDPGAGPTLYLQQQQQQQPAAGPVAGLEGPRPAALPPAAALVTAEVTAALDAGNFSIDNAAAAAAAYRTISLPYHHDDAEHMLTLPLHAKLLPPAGPAVGDPPAPAADLYLRWRQEDSLAPIDLALQQIFGDELHRVAAAEATTNAAAADDATVVAAAAAAAAADMTTAAAAAAAAAAGNNLGGPIGDIIMSLAEDPEPQHFQGVFDDEPLVAAADPSTAAAAATAAHVSGGAGQCSTEQSLLTESHATTAAASPVAAAAVSPAVQLPPPILASQRQAVALRYELLRVATFWHGSNAISRFESLAADTRDHNASLPDDSPDKVVVHEVFESWETSYRRSPLHLLVSLVTKWGEAGDPVPGWPVEPGARLQLLQLYKNLTVKLGGQEGWEALLDSQNRNSVSPFGTAAHFCIPEAVQWLLEQPELTFQRMQHHSKRGKRFYHQASTEADQMLQNNDMTGYQRIRDVLKQMLKTFIDKGRDELMRQRQQEQQRASTRARAEASLSDAVALLTPSDAAAAAAAAADADDVLKQLVEAELFHTEWKSRRPPGEGSPDYNGDLVAELVLELTKLTMNKRSTDSP